MNLNTTSGTIVGSMPYVPPEAAARAGWTLLEITIMSDHENGKVCELCGHRIGQHGVDGFSELLCP